MMDEADFRDCGKKEANFLVLRDTAMPASLTENGFIDHSNDAQKLKSDAFLNKIARGHAEGLAEALGLQKKEKKTERPNGGIYYRVITGSFKEKENTDKRVQELKNAGFDSFIDIFKG